MLNGIYQGVSTYAILHFGESMNSAFMNVYYDIMFTVIGLFVLRAMINSYRAKRDLKKQNR